MLRYSDDLGDSDVFVPLWVWATQSPRCRCYTQRPGTVEVIHPSSWKRSRIVSRDPSAQSHTAWSTVRLRIVRGEHPIWLTERAPVSSEAVLVPPWQLVQLGYILVLGRCQAPHKGGDPDGLSL